MPSSVAVGADFRVNRYLTTRAGVQYDPTPTNDNYRDARVKGLRRSVDWRPAMAYMLIVLNGRELL